MPKHKQWLSASKKQSGKKKTEVQQPETANEYLAVAVDFEEAGEKWRAGDATKSLRFCMRAISTYDNGLQHFPRSLDLSYNKARLQYEVSQQPRLLERLPTSLIELLQTALDSHRLALTIDQDNADLLFNTAQVLTSLAEAINEGKKQSGSPRDEALRLFQESLELFQRCFDIQEFKFDQTRQAHVPADDFSAATDNASGAVSSASEEIWASVEEPVTKEALLDTIVAQLDTLTSICTLGSSPTGLAWVEEYYSTTLKVNTAHYVDGSSRRHEVTLAQARLTCALQDEAFRGGRLDMSTYEKELNAVFANENLDIYDDPPGLCDKAEAELAFSASVQAVVQQAQTTELGRIGSTCWQHITKALDSLTAASKLPNVQNLPRIHLRRGDCELLRLHLGDAPLNYNLAVKSAPTLLNNAEVYFRGAANLAKRDISAEEEQNEAEVKQSVVAALADNIERLLFLVKTRRDLVQSITKEMTDEDLLGEESLQKLGSVFV